MIEILKFIFCLPFLLIACKSDLKTRSIMDFVQEVWQEKKSATAKVQQAQEEINQVKQQNDKLKEQIDMWARMNQQERKLS